MTIEPTPAAAAVEPAAVTPPPPAAVEPGPWAADFGEYFGEDADVIARADRYMREKVQPRITTLEEGTATARELWKDLTDDPETTLRDLVASVYGDDVAWEYDGLFVAPEPVEPPAAPPDDVPEWAKPLVEKHQADRDADMRTARNAEYQEAKAELKAKHTDLTDGDLKLIDPFVAAAGDMEQGYEGYKAWKAEFMRTHGVEPAPAETTPAPPPALGSQGAPAATPPVAQKYTKWSDLGNAVDDWAAEQRVASAPPPIVG